MYVSKELTKQQEMIKKAFYSHGVCETCGEETDYLLKQTRKKCKQECFDCVNTRSVKKVSDPFVAFSYGR